VPHSPHPWYRPSRNTWYVEIDKKQHRLGEHPSDLPPPKKRKGRWLPPPPILEAFYQRMAETPAEPVSELRDADAAALATIIEKFLTWVHDHRAAATYDWYRWRLQLFIDSLADKFLPAARLKHYHLDEFLARYPHWTSGMKHTACRAVLRAMRWAKKKGYVEANPVADYEKPRPGKRNLVIAPAEFEAILANAGSANFKDLLEVTWETAARPQESLIVEARHVDLANARWVFPPDESKGEQWPRIVYLSDRALAITKRLLLVHAQGPLFRNADGRPWTPYAVNCAFCRLRMRLGLQRMKGLGITVDPLCRFNRHRFRDQTALDQARRAHRQQLADRQKRLHQLASTYAPKYCLYNLRHSWLDRALKRGVDALTCAILMGHRDPSTISRVYQHLSQSPDYLREAAKRAVG
jgi:integrase